jgi:DNA-binding transcriptional LysR family regulator
LLPGNSDLKGLSKRAICKVHQIIVVPDRIGARSGMLTLKHALLDCPHVALVGDAALRQAIQQVAQTLGRDFEPQLECESISQCVAAVQTGRFAAVLPDWSWDSDCGLSHQVYDDAKLEGLEQKLVLAWNPRLLQTRGVGAKNAIESLTTQLAQDSAEEPLEDLD